VEVTADHVSVLTDMAIAAENIDEAKAEEARRAAEARLAQASGEEDMAAVQAALNRSMAQIKVRRRYRPH
jgi:F-type H+-transporting ATPase subunit epsilon